jgi:hypothetical protein
VVESRLLLLEFSPSFVEAGALLLVIVIEMGAIASGSVG